MLLSVTASVERHGVNSWVYLKRLLTEWPSRPAGAEVTELLPDVWATSRASSMSVVRCAA